MSIKAVQTVSTRNQSSVDFTCRNVFLYGNRYQENVLKNDGTEAVFADGLLVQRDATKAGQVLPAKVGTLNADLSKVIGILKVSDVTLAAAETTNVNVCVSGDIDENELLLPSGVTLETMVGDTGKALRDILTDLGFVLFNVIDNSKN